MQDLHRRNTVGDMLYMVGFWVEYVFVCVGRRVGAVVRGIGDTVLNLLLIVLRPILIGIITLIEDLTSPFVRMASGIRHIRDIPDTLVESEDGDVRRAKKKYLASGIRKYSIVVWNAITYILPAVAAAGLVVLVRSGLGLHFVLNVQVNGENVGYVESEQVFENAREDVQSRINTAKRMLQASGSAVEDTSWDVLAYYNRQQGFYSNHHLGGLIFENNTAYKNPSNYNMLNRKSSNEAVDVPGYGHIIKNNLSLSPRNSGGFPQHLINVDNTLSEIKNNSFAPNDLNLSESDFESLNEQELMGSRKSDGSLPDINFLRLTNHANFRFSGMGCFINEEAVDYSWIQEPAIVLENGVARIVGEDSKSFNKFYVNGEEVSIENGIVDLTSMSGELNLKAISENGAVTTLIINK